MKQHTHPDVTPLKNLPTAEERKQLALLLVQKGFDFDSERTDWHDEQVKFFEMRLANIDKYDNPEKFQSTLTTFLHFIGIN